MDAGGGLPAGLDYETCVGLAMNGSRMALRRVYYDGLAQTLAMSTDEVPRAVVAAACDRRPEAEQLFFDINAARARAAAGW